MKIDGNSVKSMTFIASCAVYYSSCLQIGYFRSLKIEFISLLTTYDILLSFALVSTAILLTYTIFNYILIKFLSSVRNGDGYIDAIMNISYIGPTIGFLFNSLYIYVGFTIVLIIFIVASIFIGYFDIVWFAIFSSVMLMHSAWNLSIIIKEIENSNNVRVSVVSAFLLTSGILILLFGDYYSKAFAGTRCDIKTQEITYNAIYYRSFSSGIVMKIDEEIIFIPDSELKKITCFGRKTPKNKSPPDDGR